MNLQQSQEAFHVIQQLAALCATPGVSADNIEIANKSIGNLLSKIVKPSVDELTAKASGLIVK